MSWIDAGEAETGGNRRLHRRCCPRRPARADDGAAGGDLLPVPVITIYPGDIIGAEMLADQSFPAGTSASSAILAQRQAIVGKIARRTLLPGKPIAANAIAEPDIVRRGTVTRAYLN